MINYIELGIGLHQFLASEGVIIEQSQAGEWHSSASDERTNNLIASYNPWPFEKAKKLTELNHWLDEQTEKLSALIPESEQKSWQVQVNEAFGLMPINLLGQLSEDRGIELSELIERVKTKHSDYWTAYGKLKAKRDNARDLIRAMPDAGSFERLAELWAIKCTE